MATFHMQGEIASAALKSSKAKPARPIDPSKLPLSSWLAQFKDTNEERDGPPRKKMRYTSEDSTEEEDEAHSTEFVIARYSVDLECKGFSAEDRRQAIKLCGSSPLDVGLLEVERFRRISHMAVEESNPTPLVLAGPLSQRHDYNLEVFVAHKEDSQTIKDLDLIASLERRGRAPKQHAAGPAHTRGRLHLTASSQKSVAIRLEICVLWPDGVSMPARHGNHAGPDQQILARSFSGSQQPLEERGPRSSEWSPQEFYNSVYAPPIKGQVSSLLEKPVLATELYPFQKRAVDWMLAREGVSTEVKSAPTFDPNVDVQVVKVEEKHSGDVCGEAGISFQQQTDADGTPCLVSHLQGMVASVDTLKSTPVMKGGILAEEMGLGKTCELIALICLNKRESSSPGLGTSTAENLPTTGATLIVTPLTILEQWKTELNRHAPHLTWLHYQGMADLNKSNQDESEMVAAFQEKDVILTTYNVLAKEVHYAVDPPDRSLRRRGARPARKKSPLVQLNWWRVCLDEAQMVESGVSAAATVAALIPRENAWAVSGTPLRKDVEDLHGLLIFLRFAPYANATDVWRRLVRYHNAEFKALFGRIALRHTKDKIRHELKLPPQRRVVITIPFTAVEEQNYRTLFNEMADQCGLATDGSPLREDWDPTSSTLQETMRTWLLRLRQTCLHPQVGGRNKRALGRGNAPLRTVAEVLEVMIDQNESSIRTGFRVALMTQVLEAHIIGNAKIDEHRAVKARDIYDAALERAVEFVEESRSELARAGGLIEIAKSADEESTPEHKLRMRLTSNLRSALELQHICAFFLGTAFFQIKSNTALTKEGSDDFRLLEEQETLNYDTAKAVRKELLNENAERAERLMADVKRCEDSAVVKTPHPLSRIAPSGGIENRKLLSKIHQLADIFEAQNRMIVEWRGKVISLLLKPLVDKDEGVETTGDEYEDSTKQQDEMYAYIDALRAITADRSTCLTGQINILVQHEMGVLLKEAREEKGHAPELLKELLAQRNALLQRDSDLISVRSLISEARNIETALQWQDGKSQRAEHETTIIRELMKQLQSVSSMETKTVARLEKDQDLFRSTMNQRLDFYRQLQVISDAVAPYRDELDDVLDTAALEDATKRRDTQEKALAALKTKHRFLIHLRDESQTDSQRICVICQSSFEQGVLTICGHQYCKECIHLWWNQHRTCPVCKRRLTLADFHQITYKPQELRAQEEARSDDAASDDSIDPTGTAAGDVDEGRPSIYTHMAQSTMDQVRSIDLPGSFGTKIDTLARHLLYLRNNDPGTKSIVFSQYRDFLDVLGSAFTKFGIGFSRMGVPGAIERFKGDASVECFLLDAKTDSSGLNLVNAQHVFLCEPLVNTAIELQAIARVHRIGQLRATTVYMYLIRDTIEEAIYELSVKRRLEHMARSRPSLGGLDDSSNKGKSRSVTPAMGETAIDAANSMQMQQAPLSRLLVQGKGGGEMVQSDDLWNCLFGKTSVARSRERPVLPAAEQEVNRHLRADAADKRFSSSH